jgi:hypothetical protein
VGVMRDYWICFTNGRDRLCTARAAPDVVFAGTKARQLALDVMHQGRFGFDWKNWRIIIETHDEGRFDEPFPAARAGKALAWAHGGVGK